MQPPFIVALIAAFLVYGAGFFFAGSATNPWTVEQENAERFQRLPPAQRPAMCFAPGTPVEIMRLFESEEGPTPRFQASTWWTQTATDGFTSQSDAITLRWSIIPDGTLISGGAGEPTTGSNLQSWLNNQYGSINTWLPLIEQSFARWGDATGVTYVYEPNDDGAALNGFGNNGVINVRGDVRIGGHTIDGFGNTLAYNYFPNIGDMVTIDDTVTSIFTFSSGIYSVDEDDGNLPVTVNRTGDTGAAESVDFATADDSAVNGIDYIATSGTLNFAPGQSSDTFTVPVLNNEIFAGERSFNLTLSKATGNALVGSPNTATAIILEDDMPGTFIFENHDFSTVGTIPGADDATPLASSIYPMTLDVSGVTGSVIEMSVNLIDVTHEFPRDMDILLVEPTGQAVMLLSDAGGDNNDALNSAGLTFEDSGTVVTNRDVGLVPGATYVPLNLDPVNDVLLNLDPSSPYATSLSTFAGLSPEGTWSLYFMDDWASDDDGSLGGFTLAFTTNQATPAPIEARISSIEFDGTTVTLGIISTGDANFSLQRSDKLSGWTTIEADISPGANPWMVVDDPPVSGDRWYYRLIAE